MNFSSLLARLNDPNTVLATGFAAFLAGQNGFIGADAGTWLGILAAVFAVFMKKE